MTPQQYLNEALSTQQANNGDQKERQEDKDKRSVRQALLQCFPQRDCVTMIRPCSEERDLQQINRLPLNHSRIKPEFRNQLLQFRAKIRHITPIKRVCGQLVGGKMLAQLCRTYVETLNKKDGTNVVLPPIRDCFSAFKELQSHESVDDAMRSFRGFVDRLMDDIENEPQDWKVTRDQLHARKELTIKRISESTTDHRATIKCDGKIQ